MFAMAPGRRSAFPRVLVVAPGTRARGGIASVVASHQLTAAWPEFQCRLLSTVYGKSALVKGVAALWACLRAPFSILQADMVHFHVAAGMSARRKCLIIWLAAVLRRKVIVHFHCAGAESLFEATSQRIQQFIRSRADLLVVLSSYWKKEFEQRWPGTPVAVLPNAVSWAPAANRNGGANILFVGALTRRKGYDLLLRAMATVVRQVPSAQLWMAGEGEVEDARALARKLGIDASVRFLGWVDAARLQELYAQAAILCLPSFAEGVPMAVLEAMAHGVAVITTPVGGIPDVLVDGRNGILVPPGSASSITVALLRLLQREDERRRLGLAGQKTVREAHSIGRVSQLLGEIYTQLQSRREPAAAARPVSSGSQA